MAATEKTAKTANYTEAQVETMLSMYAELGNDGLDQIAATLDKSVRSVRSKLVREGAYVAAPKAVKEKRELGPSKKELLNDLEAIVGFDVTPLQGATKEGITRLIEFAKAATAA